LYDLVVHLYGLEHLDDDGFRRKQWLRAPLSRMVLLTFMNALRPLVSVSRPRLSTASLRRVTRPGRLSFADGGVGAGP
jgi:hypothetical protein